jgi:hypothetical protein
MKKPHRIFYTKELPTEQEIDLTKAETLSDKDLAILLKKSTSKSAPKKNKPKKAA